MNTQVGSAPPLPQLSINVTERTRRAPTSATARAPIPITPGQTLTYKILVKNNSTQRADDVALVNGTQGLAAPA